MRTNGLTTLLVAAVLATAGFAMAPDTAQARRGIAIINTGEDIFPTGPLPEPYAAATELSGYQAGYKCSIFGVFWIYLYTWDCTPVAFQDETFVDDAELVSAITAKYTEADIQMGFWKGTMRWLILGVLGLAVLGIAVLAFTGKKAEPVAAGGAEPAPDEPESAS